MKITAIQAVVGCLMLASVGTPVLANEPAKEPSPPVVDAQNPLGAKVLDSVALGKQRGGTDPGTLSNMKLNGVVANNNASNLTTGNNTISDGAFAGINGVPLVVQNSGNNVLIQSATILNVQVK